MTKFKEYFESNLPRDKVLSNDPDLYREWQPILSCPPNKTKSQAFLREFLSGLTVALAQVPEAVAFAFTAGVDPIVGLQAAWIICLLTALFGGAPGMISGATGAIAVVLPEFVKEHGVGYLFIAIIIMGFIEIVLGAIGVGKLVRLIGAPVMIGFCNGLAIVIGLAQTHSFKHECEANYDGAFKGCWLEGVIIAWQFLIVFVTMAVIHFLPRLTTKFPASLAGIIIGTVIEFALVRPVGYETPLVEDLASVKGAFPKPIWLDNDLQNVKIPSLFVGETWSTVFPTSATLAVIGLVESLLTLQLVSEITRKAASPMKECLAQGFSNVIVGVFGGMGGCAMIGQSMINVKSGGVTRISSAVAGIFLLLILLVAYTLINLIPVASLAGVMFMVVIGTFEWNSLKLIFHSLLPQKYRHHPKVNAHHKINRSDVLVIVLVTVVAVLVNLAVAVTAGVLLSTVFFTWEQKDDLTVKEFLLDEDENDPKEQQNLKLYKAHGPLFFANSQAFESHFDVENDPANVELHLESAQVCDFSAISSINKIAQRYMEQDKNFVLKNVRTESMKLIMKAKHISFAYEAEKDQEMNDAVFKAMEYDPSLYDAAHVRLRNNGEGVEATRHESSHRHSHAEQDSGSDSDSTVSGNETSNKDSKGLDFV